MQDLEVEGYKRVSSLSKDDKLIAKNIALGLMDKVPDGTGEQTCFLWAICHGGHSKYRLNII